mgnify:FL=1
MSAFQIEIIKESLLLPVCSGWDRGFLESILEQVGRNRKLSTKQTTLLEQVLERNSPEAQKDHEAWEQVYASSHSTEAKLLANYYQTTGYFSSLTRDILSGKAPERAAYLKMRNNKYAKKFLIQK